ncbi:hypothetical protein IGI04_034821 [Brassica rapa subsp. trilocularis]|uniref:Uncharacterized protein n=1 Tax=Brassica rapa subsp. trilocularis TaxID=1813537 RepID=A0ABQ7LC54_BRACM|nr:hypothetical protein IGI04_034821 [Brassica rapa subsp. trilocularis]
MGIKQRNHERGKLHQTTIEVAPADQPKLVEASVVVTHLHQSILLFSSLPDLTST